MEMLLGIFVLIVFILFLVSIYSGVSQITTNLIEPRTLIEINIIKEAEDNTFMCSICGCWWFSEEEAKKCCDWEEDEQD